MDTPLYDIASSYLKEECTQHNTTASPLCEEALKDYIDGKIDEQSCKQILESCIGTSQTVDRIHAILHVLPKPLIGNEPELEMLHHQKRRKANLWTPIEDQRLLYAMHIYGSDNWVAVAQFVGNHRTKAQCSQRWFRGLDPKLIKAPWTEEEESELIRLVKLYGLKNWKHISMELKNRSDAQCRYRYNLLEKMKHNPKSRARQQMTHLQHFFSEDSDSEDSENITQPVTSNQNSPETLLEAKATIQDKQTKQFDFHDSIFEGIDYSLLEGFMSLAFA